MRMDTAIWRVILPDCPERVDGARHAVAVLHDPEGFDSRRRTRDGTSAVHFGLRVIVRCDKLGWM
jgi:hypothetical protein